MRGQELLGYRDISGVRALGLDDPLGVGNREGGGWKVSWRCLAWEADQCIK